jgi:DNA-binding NarL/FixJ family response regulator
MKIEESNHCSLLISNCSFANCSSASPILEKIFRRHRLTEQEIKVAGLMVMEGLGSKEISDRIFRAPITVKKTAAQIYCKFKVNERVKLMAFFIRELCTLYSSESARTQDTTLKEAV